MDERKSGKISRLFKDYGWLTGDDGVDRFFHRTAVVPRVAFTGLAEKDRVTFIEGNPTKGPRAEQVDIVA